MLNVSCGGSLTLQVRNQLRELKARKATGPGGISSRLLNLLHRSAVLEWWTFVQLESEAEESAMPVEDILLGTHA